MGTTGAVVRFGVRFTSGFYASGAGITNESQYGAKSWLPPARVAVVDKDGIMTPAWYRFFDYLANQRLGGPRAPAISDLETTIVGTQQTVTVTVGNVDALGQQAQANALALQATVEVSQNSALPGADQIPPVQYTPNQAVP